MHFVSFCVCVRQCSERESDKTKKKEENNRRDLEGNREESLCVVIANQYAYVSG